MTISELWHSTDSGEWMLGLKRYWNYVRPENVQLERKMDELDAQVVAGMDARQFYDFLLHRYFRWKYTAPNRYATTTAQLRKYLTEERLEELDAIKKELFRFSLNDIEKGLKIGMKIKGLGVAGASGLLALMFPRYFGTVDQFVVMSLRQVPDLPDGDSLKRMNPDQLSIRDGMVLIAIMRRKALENNAALHTDFWTPRKIDMILWTCGRGDLGGAPTMTELSAARSPKAERPFVEFRKRLDLRETSNGSERGSIAMNKQKNANGISELGLPEHYEEAMKRFAPRKNSGSYNALTEKQKQLYAVAKSLSGGNIWKVLTRLSLIKRYEADYPGEKNFEENRDMPKDFCYNSVNKDDKPNKFLLHIRRGEYRFVDFGWDGDEEPVEVYWQVKALKKTFTVGVFHDRQFSWDFRELEY
jgi:hypothetical protein